MNRPPNSTSDRCPGCKARSTSARRAGTQALRRVRRVATGDTGQTRLRTRVAHPSGRRRDPDGRPRRDRSRSPTRSSGSCALAEACDRRHERCRRRGDLVDRACRRLRVFLDELGNGAPPVPLALAPEYEAMQKAPRRRRAPAPTDLFYPDLSRAAAPRATPREIMPRRRLESHPAEAAPAYTSADCCEWLRGRNAGAAPDARGDRRDRGRHAQPSLRAFWWTVGALLEALEKKGSSAVLAPSSSSPASTCRSAA